MIQMDVTSNVTLSNIRLASALLRTSPCPDAATSNVTPAWRASPPTSPSGTKLKVTGTEAGDCRWGLKAFGVAVAVVSNVGRAVAQSAGQCHFSQGSNQPMSFP